VIAAFLLAAGVSFAHGTIRRYELDAPELHDRHRAVRVYTPPDYDDPGSASRRYPSIYLLHGWPGSEGNWPGMGRATVTADSLIASGRIPPVVLVFPNGDGSGLLGRSLYMDAYDGSSNMEQFVTRRLVAWVDSTFRTQATPERRAVVGLSDGGTAAINLVLLHPDVFGACGSHSADLRLRKGFGMGGVLGPEPGATRMLESHSPLDYGPELLPLAGHPVIYFDCGAADESAGENREFDELLSRLGVTHDYHEFPGTHDWKYWRAHLPGALVAVTAHMHDE